MTYAMDFLEIGEREAKPRSEGLTLARDPGYGPKHLDALLESAALYVDYIKFRNLVPRLWPEALLREKVALLARYEVKSFLGGIYGEYAFLQDKWDRAIDYLAEIGCSAFELSENYVEFGSAEKRRQLGRLNALGFDVLYEWGRKKPEAPLDPERAADDIKEMLDGGVTRIILEEGEVDALLGPDGLSPEAKRLDALLDKVGMAPIIFESTQPAQQMWLLKNYGSNVNLGPNLLLDEVFWLESHRRGLGRKVDWFALDPWLAKAGIPKHGD